MTDEAVGKEPALLDTATVVISEKRCDESSCDRPSGARCLRGTEKGYQTLGLVNGARTPVSPKKRIDSGM